MINEKAPLAIKLLQDELVYRDRAVHCVFPRKAYCVALFCQTLRRYFTSGFLANHSLIFYFKKGQSIEQVRANWDHRQDASLHLSSGCVTITSLVAHINNGFYQSHIATLKGRKVSINCNCQLWKPRLSRFKVDY